MDRRPVGGRPTTGRGELLFQSMYYVEQWKGADILVTSSSWSLHPKLLHPTAQRVGRLGSTEVSLIGSGVTNGGGQRG